MFCKVIQLSKEGISVEPVVMLLQLADEDNSLGLWSLKKQRKWLIDEIRELDKQIERSKDHLHSVNDEIASAKQLLNSIIYRVNARDKR